MSENIVIADLKVGQYLYLVSYQKLETYEVVEVSPKGGQCKLREIRGDKYGYTHTIRQKSLGNFWDARTTAEAAIDFTLERLRSQRNVLDDKIAYVEALRDSLPASA